MKKILLTCSLICTFIFSFAQPSNDDCSGLLDLGQAPVCPVPDTFNNVGATLSSVFSNPLENIPSCFTGGVINRDVWFSFLVPPDGSVVNFTLELTGVDGPNGSILQPQVAVYRGECLPDELQELDCVTSAPGESFVELDLLGLTPGLPYFLRISDWSASATPNWGDFVLCVKEYEPVFNMGQETYTASCYGTLYDSGGPDEDYGNSENLTFTICPSDFHQCIFINVQSISLEDDFDFLNFFAGSSVTAPQISDLTGFGSGVEIQASSSCVTIQFDSDASVNDEGFELTWACSPDTCTIPPPSTCDNPNIIPALPFLASGLTTCNAGDNISASPCNNDNWLDSDDVVFTYTSPGQECIAVNITGSNTGTGIGIFDNCPNIAVDCIAQAGGGLGQANPTINAAFLENPGTYYIVVDNSGNCTPFNIEVQQVSCPVVFPSAAFCEDALSLNGCGELPAIISVAPGQGDANFIQPDVNDGCWGGFTPNFTWFFFQAQANGEFGFIMQANNPNEASDIDFQVWGPVMNPANACDFAMLNQPVRSSYAPGQEPTGMANIHPVTGLPVTDTCETVAGDDFVSTLQVQQGKYYYVLINDYGGAITSGAVSIDFAPTTPGVLDAVGVNFQISGDTVLCPGESVQLSAGGGEVYQWFPSDGLSCTFCQNPVATISSTTTYSVAINQICANDTLEVEVGLLEVDAGQDLTVCLGEAIQIVAGASFASVSYQWNDPAGFLSCTDCPDPVVTANAPGQYTFEVTATGPSCSFMDAMTLTVLPNPAPVYEINTDQQLCQGETVALGGTATPGVSYTWSSVPAGFVSNGANPVVMPSTTTVYYLEITNAECPLSSYDSLSVTVSDVPVIAVFADTLVCQEEPVVLGFTLPEPGVTYTWSPSVGLSNPNVANPVAFASQTTTYTLTADRLGCSTEASVTLDIIEISLAIAAADTIPICKGVSVPLSASALPLGTTINWSPADGSLNTTTGPDVVAMPSSATSYVASVSVPGCVKMDTVYIGVDSLPWNMNIMPADTQICEGEKVLLISPVYEPAGFSNITFQWSPPDGQLTPDSMYNMVVQPGQTTVYQRIATNGFCSDTTEAMVTVISVTSIEVVPAQPVICEGESVQLTATSPVPIDFSWEPGTGLSCTDCPNPVASPTVTTNYAIEGEYEGCPVGGSVTVEVIEAPFILPPVGVLCPGESTVLNFAPNAAWTYAWSSPDDPGFTSNEPAPVVSPAQTTAYVVNVSNGQCPPQQFSVLVEVSDNPQLLVSNDTTICGDHPVTLTADAGVSGLYTWEPGGFAGPSYPADLQEGINTFTVSFVNACDTLSETVVVEVLPGIEILEITNNKPDTVYQGTEVKLGILTSQPATSYQWSNGSIADTAVVTPLMLPAVFYAVTVTDELGCTDTASVSITVLASQFDIPNAFSPNNDDLNQYFQVIISGENIEVLSLQVWNRWGQLVYEEQNGNTGWNGEQNGEPSPSDVYVYRIVIRLPDGTEYKESGDVTLLR